MATAAPPTPLHILVRDLTTAVLFGLILYAAFAIFDHYTLAGFNAPEILLLEAGGVVLVAYLVSRALTGAVNALMARQGGASRANAVRLFLNLLIAMGVVLALFSLAGVSLESIFLGSALAGIVLGLAAQTALSNVLAGLLLVISDPFRPGDRVTIISSNYGSTGYAGTVVDVGLTYTVLRLDTGVNAQVPNSVAMGALVLRPVRGSARAQRIRITFPMSISVAAVEGTLGGLQKHLAANFPGSPAPRLEVADLASSTWDGVIVVWTTSPDDAATRDTVLRAVLGSLPAPAKPT